MSGCLSDNYMVKCTIAQVGLKQLCQDFLVFNAAGMFKK